MKINKKIKERVKLRKELNDIISSIRTETDAYGLRLFDEYFARHLDISAQTMINVRNNKTLPNKSTLLKRIDAAKKLYQRCVIEKKII